LALIGMAGGLVPTPSALVVLLGATALGRAWFGVALVGVYGIGMASTLVAAGYALVRLEGWVARQYSESRWLIRTMRVLPTLTAAGLVIGGVSLAIRGAVAI
jgi:nickel/cobalt transporter (NicO) family protein